MADVNNILKNNGKELKRSITDLDKEIGTLTAQLMNLESQRTSLVTELAKNNVALAAMGS